MYKSQAVLTTPGNVFRTRFEENVSVLDLIITEIALEMLYTPS